MEPRDPDIRLPLPDDLAADTVAALCDLLRDLADAVENRYADRLIAHPGANTNATPATTGAPTNTTSDSIPTNRRSEGPAAAQADHPAGPLNSGRGTPAARAPACARPDVQTSEQGLSARPPRN